MTSKKLDGSIVELTLHGIRKIATGEKTVSAKIRLQLITVKVNGEKVGYFVSDGHFSVHMILTGRALRKHKERPPSKLTVVDINANLSNQKANTFFICHDFDPVCVLDEVIGDPISFLTLDQKNLRPKSTNIYHKRTDTSTIYDGEEEKPEGFVKNIENKEESVAKESAPCAFEDFSRNNQNFGRVQVKEKAIETKGQAGWENIKEKEKNGTMKERFVEKPSNDVNLDHFFDDDDGFGNSGFNSRVPEFSNGTDRNPRTASSMNNGTIQPFEDDFGSFGSLPSAKETPQKKTKRE